MNWSHPSLERPAEYSVGDGKVLHGRSLIAFVRPGKGGLYVTTPTGDVIGIASCNVEALLMAKAERERSLR